MKVVRGMPAERGQGRGGATIPLPDGRIAGLRRGQVLRLIANLSPEEHRIVATGGREAQNLLSRRAANLVTGR